MRVIITAGCILALLAGGAIADELPPAAEDAPVAAPPAAVAAPEAESETTNGATLPDPPPASLAEPASADEHELPPAAEPAPPVPTVNRVQIELDVRGELFAPTGRQTEPVRQPIAVEARFDFIERPDTAADRAAIREYAEAQACVTVAGRPVEVSLPAAARRVVVALRGTTPVPYLAAGFLSRAELDLLDTPFDALLLDRLLPAEPVAVGAKWTVPADAAAGMLAIDTLEAGSIDAELTAVEGDQATVRLAGIVDGAVDGVPTHLVIEGECAVGATAAAEPAPAWRLVATRVAAVTIRERRQAGHVAPGFEVEARVAVARRPHAAGAEAEAPTPAAPAGRRGGVGRPGMVWHSHPNGGCDLVCDARWRVVEDGPAGLVLRLVDHGALVGQCSLTTLPRADALAPPTIAAVQRDIERSLAGQFGHFEDAAEVTRDDGVRVVRIVTVGTAENLPFRWIHHVLTAADGRRAAATFMCEASAAGRFAAADREFVAGLAFPGTAAPPAAAGSPAERAARVPRETVTP